MAEEELRNRLYQSRTYGSSVIWEYGVWSPGEPDHNPEGDVCKIAFDIPETNNEVSFCHLEIEIMPRPDVSNPVGQQLGKKHNEILDTPGISKPKVKIVPPIPGRNGSILLSGMGGTYQDMDGVHTQWLLLYFDFPGESNNGGNPPIQGLSERVPHIVQFHHTIRAAEGHGHWIGDEPEFLKSERHNALMSIATSIKEPPGRYGSDVGRGTIDVVNVEQGVTTRGRSLTLWMQNVDDGPFEFNADHLFLRDAESDASVTPTSVIWDDDPESTAKKRSIPADDPDNRVEIKGEFAFETDITTGNYVYQHAGEEWSDWIAELEKIESPASKPRINPGG